MIDFPGESAIAMLYRQTKLQCIFCFYKIVKPNIKKCESCGDDFSNFKSLLEAMEIGLL